LVVWGAQLNTKNMCKKYKMTFFIIPNTLALEMKIKKLVIVLIGCFALASCATFDPKTGPTGYNSVKNIPVKNKNSSKIYIIHQPYEYPTLTIQAQIYADEKKIARTTPYLKTLYETNKPKAIINVYGYYCPSDYKDYGSEKISLDLKQGEETYLVIREKRSVFEIPQTLVFGYLFCETVKKDKSAFHDIRKVSKAAWDELANIKNPKNYNTSYLAFEDKDLEAARELLLKEQK
jgi:hypothetical protein